MNEVNVIETSGTDGTILTVDGRTVLERRTEEDPVRIC